MSSDGSPAAAVPADIIPRLLDYLDKAAALRVDQAKEIATLRSAFEAHIARHALVNDRLWKALWIVLTIASGAMAKLLLT